ncbi:MAG: sugar phosphate isomerase/epimerase family protein [Cyclobacteriaceae bacterium]|nr:sugar phosphate isomerase/epimerase family protein [Cyclobacteriaceae bacterium]
MKTDRRSFIKSSSGFLGLAAVSSFVGKTNQAMALKNTELFFKISLAEWSLNKTLFSGKLTNMEFPAKAKNDFGIHAVEYVNQFFMDKAEDEEYLGELKSRTTDLNVKNVLIMIDREGALADTDDTKRMEAVENHYKWVEAAKFLGCHSIRVNTYTSSVDSNAAKSAAIDGLSRLTEFASPYGIGIIVENHGGFSSNGQWLADVIRQVNKPNFGTLPDFGNFCIKGGPNGCEELYDRYKGVAELMPFAKGVSAKTGAFDANGNDVDTDYMKMMKIVKDAGYRGYVGIESGSKTDEDQAIRLTKALLEKVGAVM